MPQVNSSSLSCLFPWLKSFLDLELPEKPERFNTLIYRTDHRTVIHYVTRQVGTLCQKLRPRYANALMRFQNRQDILFQFAFWLDHLRGLSAPLQRARNISAMTQTYESTAI